MKSALQTEKSFLELCGSCAMMDETPATPQSFYDKVREHVTGRAICKKCGSKNGRTVKIPSALSAFYGGASATLCISCSTKLFADGLIQQAKKPELPASKAVCAACGEVEIAERMEDGRCESCSAEHNLHVTKVVERNKKMAGVVKKESVLSFLQKESEVDLENIREVATKYRELHEISELVIAQMEKLEPTLLAAKVSEFFPELEQKVVFVEGASQSKISNEVMNELLLEEIKKAATISQTALVDIGKAHLIPKYKVITGQNRNTVKVKEMTKQELKEARAK
jgi:hypothetical protein